MGSWKFRSMGTKELGNVGWWERRYAPVWHVVSWLTLKPNIFWKLHDRVQKEALRESLSL